MAISNTFFKDPNAVLDYGFDWSQWLDDSEVISGYVITITGSTLVNAHDSSTTSGSVIVWLSGGIVGQRYPVACRITTDAGRTDERTIKIDVRER